MRKSLIAVVVLSVTFGLSAGGAAAVPAAPSKTTYTACMQAAVKKAPKPLSAAKKKAIKRACKKTPAASTNPTVNDAGVMTALPSNFPKKPTAQDIASLGLTRDSKVDPDLRLPQPSGKPLVTPKLADKIVPVRVLGTTTERVASGTGYIDKQVQWVEWEVQGGQGALEYRGASATGGQQGVQSVALNPNGSVRIIQDIPVSMGNKLDAGTMFNMQGIVVPDYGQTSVPSSLSQDWKLDSERARNSVDAGFVASEHHASIPWWARGDAAGTDDGYVYVDGSGNMVGTYS